MNKITSAVNEKTNDAFTSMIDIVFLLLIFFICQPFKAPELKLGAELPYTGGDDIITGQRLPDDIKISIRALPSSEGNAAIYVDGKRAGTGNQLDKKQLVSRIASMLKSSSLGHREIPVAILPSEEVQIKHVLTALDACYAAEMPHIKFGYGN